MLKGFFIIQFNTIQSKFIMQENIKGNIRGYPCGGHSLLINVN